MRVNEKLEIFKHIAFLNNMQLEDEAYGAIHDTLGSEVEEMEERGYSDADVKEREKYEKYLSEKASLYELCCEKRGIELWREPQAESEKA